MSYNILLLQVEAYCLDCFWWWLFSFGAFLLGWLLNWLLFTRRKDEVINTLTRERDDYHTRYVNVEKDFSSLKYQYDESQKDNTGLRTSLQRCEADKAVLATKLDKATSGLDDSNMAAGIAGAAVGTSTRTPASRGDIGGDSTYASLFSEDNLQIVDGIGPKIESLLKDDGINVWSLLAAATQDRLREILDNAGPRYRIHDPSSWPHQAQMADNGEWEKLIEYQKFSGPGREAKSGQPESKFEKMASKAMGFSSQNPDDLKVVEGIGPKIESLLKGDGINTWSDLASTSIDRLQKILNNAGDRYRLADPKSWPKQAEMAAARDWSGLKSYQDELRNAK